MVGKGFGDPQIEKYTVATKYFILLTRINLRHNIYLNVLQNSLQHIENQVTSVNWMYIEFHYFELKNDSFPVFIQSIPLE